MEPSELLDTYVAEDKPRYKVGDKVYYHCSKGEGYVEITRVHPERTREGEIKFPWVYDVDHPDIFSGLNEGYMRAIDPDRVKVECPKCERVIWMDEMADYLCQDCR
jgi:hypothetical protein